MTKHHLRYLILAVLLGLTLTASLLGWDTLTMPRRYALTTTARAAFGSGNRLLLGFSCMIIQRKRVEGFG